MRKEDKELLFYKKIVSRQITDLVSRLMFLIKDLGDIRTIGEESPLEGEELKNIIKRLKDYDAENKATEKEIMEWLETIPYKSLRITDIVRMALKHFKE